MTSQEEEEIEPSPAPVYLPTPPRLPFCPPGNTLLAPVPASNSQRLTFFPVCSVPHSFVFSFLNSETHCFSARITPSFHASILSRPTIFIGDSKILARFPQLLPETVLAAGVPGVGVAGSHSLSLLPLLAPFPRPSEP